MICEQPGQAKDPVKAFKTCSQNDLHQQKASCHQTHYLPCEQKHPIKTEFVENGGRFKKEGNGGCPYEKEHQQRAHQETEKQTQSVRQHFWDALEWAGLHILCLLKRA
jgi:hypothetical protein